MAGKRLAIEELSKILNAPQDQILKAIDELQDKYRGPIHIHLDSEAGTVLMTVEGRYIEDLWMLGKGELSHAELRTLATIAFYEPVRQSEIVKARGNRAYEHIRTLADMGLLSASPQGNTKVLRLTRKFYDYFGDDVAERIRSSPVVVKSKRKAGPAGPAPEASEEGGQDMAEGVDIRIRDVRRN